MKLVIAIAIVIGLLIIGFLAIFIGALIRMLESYGVYKSKKKILLLLFIITVIITSIVYFNLDFFLK